MRKFWYGLGAVFVAAGVITSVTLGAGLFKPKSYLVYIGTYTNNTKSKGIYAYRFEPSTGELSSIGLEAETSSPSYLATDHDHKYLFAVNEAEIDGKKTGGVSSWTMDRSTGKLSFLNTVSSKGDGPCHLAVDRTGRTLVVANYGGGSISSFPVGLDGRLGEAATFDQHTGAGQQKPHAHCANFSADNRFVVTADLGLDKLIVYKVNPGSATLTPNNPPWANVAPGSGPRHFAFHPNNRYAYVINETASTVTAFDYDHKRGALKDIQTLSTLPADFKGENTTAEIFAHPNGRFVYGSNRGHDSIAVFSIDKSSGKLTLVENVPTQGKTPRGFAIDPTGRYLFAANQDTDNVVVFQIDPGTGRLKSTGKTMTVGSPVCVLFVDAK